MKKLILAVLVIIVISSVIFLSLSLFDKPSDKTYTLSDFENIIVDKSTLEDVATIAPNTVFTPTGTGANCTILLDDGKELYIKFYGPEMIVGDMEIIE